VYGSSWLLFVREQKLADLQLIAIGEWVVGDSVTVHLGTVLAVQINDPVAVGIVFYDPGVLAADRYVWEQQIGPMPSTDHNRGLKQPENLGTSSFSLDYEAVRHGCSFPCFGGTLPRAHPHFDWPEILIPPMFPLGSVTVKQAGFCGIRKGIF